MAALKKKPKPVKKRIPQKKAEAKRLIAVEPEEEEISDEAPDDTLSFATPDHAYRHIHDAAKSSAEKYTYLSLSQIEKLDSSLIEFNKTIRNARNEIAVKLTKTGFHHVKSLEETMPLHFAEPREVPPPALREDHYEPRYKMWPDPVDLKIEMHSLDEAELDDESMLPIEWIDFKPEPLKGRGRQQQYPFRRLKPPIKDPQTGKTLYASFFVPSVEGVADMRKRLMPSVARAIKQLHPALFECRNVEGGARVWRTL